MYRKCKAAAAQWCLCATAAVLFGWISGPHAQTRPPAPGNWPMAGKDYANTRYSELTQITAANVKELRLAFNFSTGVVRGHEASPVVVDGTMYIITPYPNIVYALDLAKPGAREHDGHR